MSAGYEYKNIRRHSTVKLVIKAAAALIGLVWLLMFLAAALLVVAENGDTASKADLINWCDSDYYERDYAALYDTLTVFDLYDEDFDHYWEAAEGYRMYTEYRQRVISGDGRRAAELLEQLKKLAESPEFTQNENLLTGFYEDALAYKG